MSSDILMPYEEPCPECQGKGYLGTDGKPWEGEVGNSEPGYMDAYSKCWNPHCKGGVLLTRDGEALLGFIKRHLEVDVSSEWRR